MRLTNYTEYALRTLMYINAAPKDKLVTVEEVSTFYEMPINHLKKIFWNLNELGYLHSIRGRNGGYKLNVEPTSIRLGSLIKELENLELISLVEVKVNAQFHNPCSLTEYVEEALSAFLESMNQYTLHDLVNSNLKLLEISKG
ncbi:RrF2 family transcriptional regulator [Alkalicoccobacillus plakortidis]|uniref:HTH-type transcriptional regulator NsrR n=1 Tax=Alkalicoccobacillus plakortidis TaxID=444060 RepID=A0ABT0XP00_9BACI|nr:Rrf2 family transcriptional regulator [Alkalicoccobacillus plakortidis]MCM2677626.1 Rrf2 family transcriptional regulator [Alkalicoccobacillus plakortidis]